MRPAAGRHDTRTEETLEKEGLAARGARGGHRAVGAEPATEGRTPTLGPSPQPGYSPTPGIWWKVLDFGTADCGISRLEGSRKLSRWGSLPLPTPPSHPQKVSQTQRTRVQMELWAEAAKCLDGARPSCYNQYCV